MACLILLFVFFAGRAYQKLSHAAWPWQTLLKQSWRCLQTAFSGGFKSLCVLIWLEISLFCLYPSDFFEMSSFRCSEAHRMQLLRALKTPHGETAWGDCQPCRISQFFKTFQMLFLSLHEETSSGPLALS